MINLIETKKLKEEIYANPDDILEIIEKTNIGVCITNKNADFVAVNQAYANIYGYEKEELIGNSFLIVVPNATKEQLMFLHDKFLNEKRELSRAWTVVRKTGEEMEISVDTGYSEEVFDKTPHKITFVQRDS